MSEDSGPWIVSQIGAREHYAIPRALHRRGCLGLLCTDTWIRPGSVWSCLPGTRRLRDRWHPDLDGVRVFAPNSRILAFEAMQRIRRRQGWETILARNTLYQRLVIRHLSTHFPTHGTRNEEPGTRHRSPPPTLFSYSCAALELFRFAKSRGWRTVLGQIDPGPEEERLVAEEHRRQAHLKSSWNPSPPVYWERWRKEVELADRILVNSDWSRQCLLKEGVPGEKMEVVPLVYEKAMGGGQVAVGGGQVAVGGGRLADGGGRLAVGGGQLADGGGQSADGGGRFEVLFLGQINLRKGVGRLLEAMRELRDEPIFLTLAGPGEIDPSAWADLPQVKWVGMIPRSEVGRLYEAADLFILPTISDGYALTQLEALAHGLPVLASRACGNAVTHGENGWLLDDLEPSTIANAIRAAREALPLPNVAPPRFGLEDLGESLVAGTPERGGR